jgi:hypothetical protein
MTTGEATSLEPEEKSSGRSQGVNWGRWISGLAVIAFAGLFLAVSRTELAPRVANPNVQGRPRPVDFSVGSWFITTYQIAIVVLLLGMILAFCIAWRRNPGHPVLLMAICTTLIVWQDPIMNWAPFAVYNPDWLHWPEDWPLISMSPTVEPFFVFSYAIFYLVPYFPGIWITRKLQAKGGPESFAARHPLVTLALVVLVVGFVYDMIMEVVFIRTGMYIYSQVIPFGSLWPGTTFQFPLLWESLGVTFVMIPAAVLCYRDDTGKSVAEKLAAKAKLFPAKPVLGTFLVMFAITNVSYFVYGAWFWAIKASGAATAVACPWPYPEAKVYDPQGYYEKEGAVGPYSVGKWATWQSGVPNGRPDVEAPPAGQGACAPGEPNG